MLCIRAWCLGFSCSNKVKEGKPEAMLDNIAKGKLKRFFKDNTLVNQAYIKEAKQSVADYVKSVNGELTVTGFKRVALV